MSNVENFSWDSGEGFEIIGKLWKTDGEPHCAVCLIHGLGEHSGRYEYLISKFNEVGIAVLTFDLRGHGLSGGKRGHSSSYEALVSDIDKLIKKAEEYFPHEKIFLYGHSMGGNLVLNYSLQYPEKIRAVISTSPWLILPKNNDGFVVSLAKLLSKFLPSLTVYNGVKSSDLSHDDQIISERKGDEFSHNKISIKTFADVSLKAKEALLKAPSFSKPLLLMHGTKDKITSPKGSVEFAKGAGNGCDLKIWEDAFHELHNEENRDEVIEFIINWIKKIIKK